MSIKDSTRNRQNGFETLDDFPKARSEKTKKIVLIIVAVIAILVLIGNSTYQIKEQEQAVLITFGQATAVTDPGLHFKIPFVQEVKKVNTTIQGFSIGYDTASNTSNEYDSLMITSDYNFVNVDFFVE